MPTSLSAIVSVEDDPTIAVYVPKIYRAKRATIDLMDGDRLVVALALVVDFHDPERLKRLAAEIAAAIEERCIPADFR